jgi:hypothetical protein
LSRRQNEFSVRLTPEWNGDRVRGFADFASKLVLSQYCE